MSDEIEITPKKDNVISFDKFAQKADNEASSDNDSPKPKIKLPKHGDLNHQLKEVIKTMTPVERKIVILRYGLDDGHKRTKKEVSIMLDVPVEKISQAESKAMAILNDLHNPPPEKLT